MVILDRSCAVKCCWTCASLLGSSACTCLMCQGASFLRLYTAPFSAQGGVHMFGLQDAVCPMVVSLLAPLAVRFLTRLISWVSGVGMDYKR